EEPSPDFGPAPVAIKVPICDRTPEQVTELKRALVNVVKDIIRVQYPDNLNPSYKHVCETVAAICEHHPDKTGGEILADLTGCTENSVITAVYNAACDVLIDLKTPKSKSKSAPATEPEEDDIPF
ncbi:MAG: hypothetical protein IRY99_23825, partial [Isosphaeraceae bacterium]|nr:hypothetical protein [Isosphaeraceae bacterium]